MKKDEFIEFSEAESEVNPARMSGGLSWSQAAKLLSPRAAFVGGLLMAVLGMTAIGFFLLLPTGLRSLTGQLTVAGAAPSPQLAAPAVVPSAEPTPEAPAGAIPPLTAEDHIRGDAGAKLTWIEYSDFECPFCKRFHPTMLKMLEEFKGKIKFVYRHYPLSFHANAEKEAEASECAAELGGNKAFWAYVDKIFERTTANGTGFALGDLAPLAKELGLNSAKFQSCLDSGKYAAKVQQQQSGGQAAGVNGTPGSFLIGRDGKAQLISGAVPYEQVKAAIEAQLK